MADTRTYSETIPGGAYLQAGRWVNADGIEIYPPSHAMLRAEAVIPNAPNTPPAGPTAADIEAMNLDDFNAYLGQLTTAEQVNAVAAMEKSGKNRAGAAKHVAERLAALES